MREVLWDYGLEMCGVTVYGDPASHSPGACGHMINDPRGTTSEANCVVCPLGGGALVGIVTLREVSKGEELFMNTVAKGVKEQRHNLTKDAACDAAAKTLL